MEKRTKIILLITGAVIVVGSIGLGVYFYYKNKEGEDNSEDDTINPYAPSSKGSGDSNSESESETGEEGNEETPEVSDSLIRPTYNIEGELSNHYGQVINRYLYPKRKSQGGWDYTNVRESMEVNTDYYWGDGLDNLITTIKAGSPIGKVVSISSKTYNNYAYRWFKVKLSKQVGGWFSNYVYGYVRADTVTFKPY